MTETQLASTPAGVPSTPAAAPTALPKAFHRLFAASAASSLGDGVYLAALPLLAAALTRDPFQIALVTSAALAPWFFFGLIGGALVDRWDRRRTMWVTDLLRAGLLAVPAVAAGFHWLSVPLLIAVAFLLGTGQIFFDSAGSGYLPELLGRDLTLLEKANSRQMGSQSVARDFVGPPAGAALFALARALPFGLDALSFLASSLLIRTLPPQPVAPSAGERSLWADARSGAAFLFRDKVLLGLALRPAIGNLAFAATETVLVLFARQMLHLGSLGYGVLLTAQAVGGLLGAVLAGRLRAWMGIGAALTMTALLEGLAEAGLGLSAGPWPALIAALSLALLGAAMAATMVLAPSVTQALVPTQLAGRVSAARRLLALGAAPVGALLGGWLATVDGLRAPFVVGAVLLAGTGLLSVTLTSTRRIEAALAERAH
ncbi:MFS transporter [Kitasatospora viridis]|uniref:Putative MFS family arabinose efflux permease n=1 Tax=Kitasatospora viridis TaxID=281105 RepID=A0A561UF43_9ACTN|nr:MFS transporter [Kitasatospora viridis]TWF97983.1 putative MFS family arabinose efflux permease [Kitasatospora viridis]